MSRNYSDLDYAEWRDRYNEPPEMISEPLVACADCGDRFGPFITNPWLRGVRCHACYPKWQKLVMAALAKKQGAA